MIDRYEKPREVLTEVICTACDAREGQTANGTGPQNLSCQMQGMSRQGSNKHAAVKQHLARNPNPLARARSRGRSAKLLPLSGSERTRAVVSGTSLFNPISDIRRCDWKTPQRNC